MGLTLGYGPLTIAIESNEAAPLTWLEQFLAPAFEPVDAVPDRSVELVIDPRSVEASTGSGGTAGAIDGFVFDTRVDRFAILRETAEDRWIRDPELEVTYRIARASGDVTVLAAADGPRARVALMRVVRELAMVDVRRRGGVLLHAAGAARDGWAVAVCGPKRAGKTSTLLHALTRPGTAYVSNDRLAVTGPARGADGAGWQVRGVPTVVALRHGTIRLFPKLAERLRTSAATHPQTTAEISTRPQKFPWGDALDGADVSPWQLGELADRPLLAGGHLAAVVLPRLDTEARGLAVRRLNPDEAWPRLLAGRLAAELTRAVPEAFLPRGLEPADAAADVLGADTAETLGRLSHEVPCLELTLGHDAFSGDPGAVRFWDAVLERTAAAA